jgi:hypothetical protein
MVLAEWFSEYALVLWSKYFALLFLAPRLRLNLKTTWEQENGEICAWTCTSALMSL